MSSPTQGNESDESPHLQCNLVDRVTHASITPAATVTVDRRETAHKALTVVSCVIEKTEIKTVLSVGSRAICVVEVSTIGGAKKKSFAQMEKAQVQQDRDLAQTKKGKTKSASTEKSRAVELQGVDDSKLLGEISKMNAITPYAVSSHFNIRIGAAKDILEELERRRVLTNVGGNARVRIYRAVAA